MCGESFDLRVSHRQVEGRAAEAPAAAAAADGDGGVAAALLPDAAAEALEALVALLADSPDNQEAFMSAQGAGRASADICGPAG